LQAFDLELGSERGLTHVLDKGLGPRAWEDVLETAGDYIDIVKLGWGTAYVTSNLERKLEVLAGKPVVIGGTFFEAVYLKDRIDDYKSWLTRLGLSHVEISDGTVEIPRERKLALIADFARDFTVLSEVGAKDSEVVYAPELWVQWINEELEAGAWKVVTEGREGGTSGVFRPSGEMRTGLVDEIVAHVDPELILFEAPTKSSQAWFLKRFGPTVHLGNIPVDEVIPLETLRRGLRADTLNELLVPAGSGLGQALLGQASNGQASNGQAAHGPARHGQALDGGGEA
jgi:phosphosulfolactate synthase